MNSHLESSLSNLCVTKHLQYRDIKGTLRLDLEQPDSQSVNPQVIRGALKPPALRRRSVCACLSRQDWCTLLSASSRSACDLVIDGSGRLNTTSQIFHVTETEVVLIEYPPEAIGLSLDSIARRFYIPPSPMRVGLRLLARTEDIDRLCGSLRSDREKPWTYLAGHRRILPTTH